MPSRPDLAVPIPAGDAAEAALAFLLGGQDDRGAWRDFFLPAGESDGWVSAYVGLALAQIADDRARNAAIAAWRHLERAEKPGGGWGYNQVTPADADSTIWALRLAAALGESGSGAAMRGTAFLQRHRRGNGGVATYASGDGPRGYVGLPATVDFGAWTEAHVCVSAAAAALPGLPDAALRAFLLERQGPEGAWPSYWWFDPGYATAEAVEALGPGAHARRAASHAAWRVMAWARSGKSPPAFGLAHALRIMVADGEPSDGETVARAGDMLCALQADNGSWPASARLRVPAPDCRAPDPEARWKPWHGLPAMPGTLDAVLEMTFTITSLDHRRAFTTATALRALTAWARAA